MPLTLKRKLAFLADTPYLKFVRLDLDAETKETLLEDVRAATKGTGDAAAVPKYQQMRKMPSKFTEYTNMSVNTFDYLMSRIGHKIKKIKSNFMPSTITTEIRLIIALRYLIGRESYTSLAAKFGIGRTTCTDIILDVCGNIYDTLNEEYLPFPTSDKWASNMDNFYSKTGFPNCFGILQGVNMTVVRRDSHQRGPTPNRYTYYLLETIIDDGGFLVTAEIQTGDPDVNTAYSGVWPSGIEDINIPGLEPRVFPLSETLTCWEQNFIPSRVPLPDSDQEAPFILLADEQYPATNTILQPDKDPDYVYNYKIELAKKEAESIFRKMMSRWSVFKRPLTCSEKVARAMLQAIAVLHNFILTHDGTVFLDALPEPPAKWQSARATVMADPTSHGDALQVRQIFRDYFLAKEQS